MTDPITPAIYVKWSGKTYPVQLTLGALAGASRILKTDLLGADMIGMPATAVGPLYLFAMLHRLFPSVTIADCEDAFYESPQSQEHYVKAVQEARDSIESLCKPFADHRRAQEAKEAGPLEASDSGDACGATRS